MGRMILLISLFSLTIGLSQNSKSKVYFEIEQKEVRDSTWLKVKLVNNSKQNIWIALDTIRENQKRNYVCMDEFYKGLKMGELICISQKGESWIGNITVMAGNFDCTEDEEHLIKNKNKLILLRKGEKTVFDYFFTLKKMQRTNPYYYREHKIDENIKKDGHITLSFVYSMSHQWTKRYIRKELLRELDEAHYIPFIGYIRSNEVKFLFSKSH